MGKYLVTLVAVLSCLVSASFAEELTYSVRAKGYLDPDGELVKNVTLVVQDGRIKKIGKRVQPPDGAVVLDRSTSFIGPGLIDIHVMLGTMGRTGESSRAIEPNAHAVDLVNASHPDFLRAASAGVTTVVLSPSSVNIVGGATYVLKTGDGEASSRQLGDGPLYLSFASRAFAADRTPTSLQGALDELRRRLVSTRGDQKDESAFAKWARSERAAFVEVDDAAAMSSLARFAKEEGLKCIPVHANYAAERLEDARSFNQPIVLGVYEFSDPFRFTRAPAILESVGVPVALTSQPPRYAPELLRVGAAIAMRQGLSRKAALASITTIPAEILGLQQRIGKIAPGMDADFVLYDGDPMRLSSRIEAVFIGGRMVYSRKHTNSESEVVR
ncbi:MAG: amidohydrolase family protein [Phycisphaerae bacterium]|nr:amidohydrolase family protein [Phycisphaerae bacterium]